MVRRAVAAAAAAILAATAVMTTPAAGQQQPAGVIRTPGGVQVDFQNTDMRLVVAALADAAGLNVVYGDLPQKTVTLRTTQPVAPSQLRVYLNSLLQANQLELKDEGAGLLRIVPNEAAAARAAQPQAASPAYAGPQDGSVRVFVHRLRHAPAEDMARSIGALFGIGDGAAGQDRAQSLTEQLRGQSLDANGQPRVPRAQPGMNAALQGQVQIFADARTNALLIRATPADYETLRQAIDQLDTRPLQVMIEVVIAEVRRNSQFGLGVDVRVPTQTIGNEGSTTIGGELIGGTAGDVALRILKLGNVQANVILHALAASGEVTILSRPVIMAQNNEPARILVGDQRPFIQISRSLPTDNAVRDQVIQYRDVGTQLTIRPTVNPDGYVTLAILQEVSNATSETQFGAPIISTREAETRLLVQDGHTVVIGGLIDHQRNSSNSGIPILKDIPILGALFRSTSRQKTSTELFLFLVPHVLYSDADMDSATQMVRDRTERLDRALPDSIPLFWKSQQDTTGAPGRPRAGTPLIAPQPAQPQQPPQGGGTPTPESDEVALVDVRRRN
ncbi:type II secretion system protein GspD [Longimicrobium sp.]|uniref:type II secretion system protein GspD n=1 Tax=Longimicrobium sp. TaxID=2029185 RepID=UPI002B730BA0|nr:secretin N-terminal domain-containing protein [Longimicrobium sp.]HSU15693.1 secretin N-terminal domain-containing protein [Longimicrobium sp.]